MALLALFAGPVSGVSMNPARSIGPALATLTFESQWIYLIVPVIGMWLASPLGPWKQGKDCCATASMQLQGHSD